MKDNRNLDLKELSKNWSKLGYQEIRERMISLEPSEELLVQFINDKSRKVGNTAVELLNCRCNGYEPVIKSILGNNFTHKDSKIRALNLLAWFGRKAKGSLQASTFLLNDKNNDVVANALFIIAFWQDSSVLPILEKHLKNVSQSTFKQELILKAIKSIKEKNPNIYSPHFHDSNSVWGELKS